MNAYQRRFVISVAFVAAYFLLIISTVIQFRAAEGALDYLMIFRMVFYALIMMIWLVSVVANPQHHIKIAALLLLLAPFLLTPAYMISVDTAVVFVVAASLNAELLPTRVFFRRAAYASMFTVICIAALAAFRLLPSLEFEWNGRVKESVGFLNPNTFYYYLFSSAFILFLVEELFGFFIIGIVMAVFYSVVESRTFFFAYLLLAFHWAFAPLFRQNFRNTVVWLGMLLAIGSGLVSSLYPVETSVALSVLFGIDPSEILSNRLEIIDEGSGGSLISLFGGHANYADSLYVYLISGLGMPLGLAAIGIVLGALWRKPRTTSNGRLLMAAFVYFSVGCFEVPYGGSSLIAVFFIWELFFSRQYSETVPGAVETPTRRRLVVNAS